MLSHCKLLTSFERVVSMATWVDCHINHHASFSYTEKWSLVDSPITTYICILEAKLEEQRGRKAWV